MSGTLDLLGEFHHEPVGVEQMQCPICPEPIGWAGEDLSTGRPSPGRLAISILDKEGDLSARSASTRVPPDPAASRSKNLNFVPSVTSWA
jgi:hypothetical protein